MKKPTTRGRGRPRLSAEGASVRIATFVEPSVAEAIRKLGNGSIYRGLQAIARAAAVSAASQSEK